MAKPEVDDRITGGLVLNTLINETLAFVQQQLPRWRDDSERPYEISEENLNMQLCKFLNVNARHQFPMAHFNHEEKQTSRRRIDLSVTPHSLIIAGARSYSKYEPFLVIEGKRLPAPNNDREKEYVTGFDDVSGGLQRFKMGLHGASLEIAAMIGYIQDGDPDSWLVTINGWISSLSGTDCSEGCQWYTSEQIGEYQKDDLTRIATSVSKHPRSSRVGTIILIHHLWVSMLKPEQDQVQCPETADRRGAPWTAAH
jgi:hypothetical protein